MEKYSKQDIIDELNSRIGKGKGQTTMRQLAIDLGENYTSLADVLYGIKQPTAKILEALSLEKKTEVYYVKRKTEKTK